MSKSSVPLFLSIAVLVYILVPRCIFFLTGKVTTMTQTLVVTLLASLVIFFLTIILKKKSR